MKTSTAQLSANEKFDGIPTRKGASERRDEIVAEIKHNETRVHVLKEERKKAIALALDKDPQAQTKSRDQNKLIAKIEEEIKNSRAKLKTTEADCAKLAKNLPVPVPEPIDQAQVKSKIKINKLALERRLNELKVEAGSDISAHNLYNNTLNFSNAQVATLNDPNVPILLPLLENFAIYFPVLRAAVHLEITRGLEKLLKSHKAADVLFSNEELARVRRLETFYESLELLEKHYNQTTEAIKVNKYFMQTPEQISLAMRTDSNLHKLEQNIVNADTLIREVNPFVTAMQNTLARLAPNTLPSSINKSVSQHMEAITKLLGLLQLQIEIVVAKNLKIDEVTRELPKAVRAIPALLRLNEQANAIFKSRIFSIAEISFLQQQKQNIIRLVIESVGLYAQKPQTEDLKVLVAKFYDEYLLQQQKYLEAAQAVELSPSTTWTQYNELLKQSNAATLAETYPSLTKLKLELEAHGLCPENSRLSQLSNSLHRIVHIFEMIHLVQTY